MLDAAAHVGSSLTGVGGGGQDGGVRTLQGQEGARLAAGPLAWGGGLLPLLAARSHQLPLPGVCKSSCPVAWPRMGSAASGTASPGPGGKAARVHLACWDRKGSLLLPGPGQLWPSTATVPSGSSGAGGGRGSGRAPGGLVPEYVVPRRAEQGRGWVCSRPGSLPPPSRTFFDGFRTRPGRLHPAGSSRLGGALTLTPQSPGLAWAPLGRDAGWLGQAGQGP